MRYLTLAEALVIAEAVTGVDAAVLAKMPRVGLLDSALHAPQASFAGEEFYPDFFDKAAVLAVHVARNHPLPDGNKRLTWACLALYCELNGFELRYTPDDAVDLVLGIASGESGEEDVASWLRARAQQTHAV